MENKKIFWKTTMNYGAILGGLALVLSILSDITHSSLLSWLLYTVVIYFVYRGTKNYRDKYLNGFISYGNSVLFGTLVVAFAGIILTFLSFIILNYVSPELKEEIMRTTEEKLLERGISEDMVEQLVSSQDQLSKPIPVLISGIFLYGIIGLIISLFISIFLRKEPNPFQNIGGENQDSTDQISE